MGLTTILSNWFGKGAGDGRLAVVLNGAPTQVSRSEFEGLNKLAESGAIRKSISDDALTLGGGGTPSQGVPAFWFARAVEGNASSETLSMPYARSVWVQRAIKMVSGPVSGVDLLFSPKGSRTVTKGMKGVRKDLDDYVEIPEMAAWLRRPMPGYTYNDFVEASIGWLKIAECFWLLDDSTLVPFPEARTTYPPVIVARPDRMRHIVEDGKLVGWVYTPPGRKPISLLPEQVIQLKYWNPYDDFRGLGEYAPAHIAAEADWLAGKFSRNLMANNGDLGGIIIAKNGVPTDPQREQIIMDLRSKRAAQLRGELRYTFMTGDIDVKDPKITSVDVAFIGQRLENRHEIALAFGVPPSMFDVKAAYSVGSASDYYRMLTDTCIPTGAKFCDALATLVYRLTGQEVDVALDWDDHPVMQQVLRERFDAADKLWSKGMPMSAISDYLGLELPRFDGDDVGYLPMNVVTAEQAAEPEPPPAVNPGLAEPMGDATAPGTATGQATNPETGEPEEVKAVRRMLADRMQAKGLMAAGKRKTLWEHHMRARAGTVKAFEGKVNRVLNTFRAKALKRLADAHGVTRSVDGGVQKTSRIDLIFNAKEFGIEIMAAVRPVMGETLQTAANQVMGEIGVVNPWEFPPAKALEYITGRTESVQGCGETVRGQLNTTLEAGYVAGEGIDELSDRVRGVFNNLQKYESKRIAMTETAMSFNFSRHETMAAAGVRYKSWLSSHGPTVRPAHAEAEARYQEDPIPIDEPFEVGGEYLMHPGSAEGSPENVINCQCIELAVKKAES